MGGSGDVHIDFHVVRHHSLNIVRTTSLCARKIKLAQLCMYFGASSRRQLASSMVIKDLRSQVY